MSSNTLKKVTKRNKKKKQTKKQKGGVKLFSKSKSVSNTNNDEKEFITNQNEMINELNSELLTLDKQNTKQNEIINELKSELSTLSKSCTDLKEHNKKLDDNTRRIQEYNKYLHDKIQLIHPLSQHNRNLGPHGLANMKEYIKYLEHLIPAEQRNDHSIMIKYFSNN
jgi:predicted RNase H-like nuclease (RuvC/YqgF family)